MERDEEICLCFHVTRRKLENYIRLHQPRHVSQLSECFGAGTGCGWCQKYLRVIFEMSGSEDQKELSDQLPIAGAYADMRRNYICEGKGTPPPESDPRSASQ